MNFRQLQADLIQYPAALMTGIVRVDPTVEPELGWEVTYKGEHVAWTPEGYLAELMADGVRARIARKAYPILPLQPKLRIS